jgi:hypothetical protein
VDIEDGDWSMMYGDQGCDCSVMKALDNQNDGIRVRKEKFISYASFQVGSANFNLLTNSQLWSFHYGAQTVCFRSPMADAFVMNALRPL